MAFKSSFTGAKVDELLTWTDGIKTNPADILEDISATDILNKLTGQQLIDKINSVSGNIVFTRFVDCQAGAGKTES